MASSRPTPTNLPPLRIPVKVNDFVGLMVHGAMPECGEWDEYLQLYAFHPALSTSWIDSPVVRRVWVDVVAIYDRVFPKRVRRSRTPGEVEAALCFYESMRRSWNAKWMCDFGAVAMPDGIRGRHLTTIAFHYFAILQKQCCATARKAEDAVRIAEQMRTMWKGAMAHYGETWISPEMEDDLNRPFDPVDKHVRAYAVALKELDISERDARDSGVQLDDWLTKSVNVVERDGEKKDA